MFSSVHHHHSSSEPALVCSKADRVPLTRFSLRDRTAPCVQICSHEGLRRVGACRTSGFRSRCTTPTSCMWLTADTSLRMMRLASVSLKCCFLRMRSSSSPPPSSSRTRKVWSCSKTKKSSSGRRPELSSDGERPPDLLTTGGGGGPFKGKSVSIKREVKSVSH